MFGGAGKIGRGGGAGRGAKRLIPPAPPRGGSRLSIGGGGAGGSGRQRNGVSGAEATGQEETFRLVASEPLAYGLMIRLSPDILEEIKRAEAHGAPARIKFDGFPNNVSGNVIDIGGKDFRFIWSCEYGECDIYEEREHGEDGNGLLVESGSVWRKLNVQRVLDESIKNHVKMRSEEAERQLKSRKAIVLDPANPSVKNQAKTMAAAAVEGNMRRFHFKQKKEAFKKCKVENQGPPKSALRPSIPSSARKGRPSVSPQPSPPMESTVAPSTSPIESMLKSRKAENNMALNLEVTGKEELTRSEKEILGRPLGSAAYEVSRHEASGKTDAYLNSGRKTEAIVKKVSTSETTGRHHVKDGVKMDGFKKRSSESGNSPDSVRLQSPVAEQEFDKKTTAEELELQIQLESVLGDETNIIEEKTESQHNSPDTNVRKYANKSEDKVDSSTGSGSDSDSESDSSDSGSDSGSHSRSRSPAGSRSGSSSDSESDGTSSSKEGSDVDVDIISDEEKEMDQKPQGSVSRVDWETHGNELGGNAVNKSSEDHLVSSSDFVSKHIEQFEGNDEAVDIDIDIMKDSPIPSDVNVHNQTIEIDHVTDVVLHPPNSRSLGEESPLTPEGYKTMENRETFPAYINDMSRKMNQREMMSQQSDFIKGASKFKPKRSSDPKLFHDNPENKKSLKVENSMRESIVTANENSYLDSQRTHNRAAARSNIQSGHGHSDLHSSVISDLHNSSEIIGDSKARRKTSESRERPGRYNGGSRRGSKNSERDNVFPDEPDGSSVRSTDVPLPVHKDNQHKGSAYESSDALEKPLTKSFNESVVGDSVYRNTGDRNGKSHGFMQPDRGSMLRRELSDLELGEFREPMLGETEGPKKQFERQSSFKSPENEINETVHSEEAQGVNRQSWVKNLSKPLENKLNTSHLSSDLGKGKIAGKSVQQSKRKSPSSTKVASNQEGYRKRFPEYDVEDASRRQFMAVDSTDSDFQSDKCADSTGKVKKNEGRTSQETVMDSHMEARRKTSVPLEPKIGGITVISDALKENKPNKASDLSTNGKRKRFQMDSCANGRKTRESSSDEDNNSLYMKYDKNEPELKGAIKDHVQYKEYVKEYLEMYAHYSSIREDLENYRNDFSKLGRELGLAKGRDTERYYYILEQLKDSYRHSGMVEHGSGSGQIWIDMGLAETWVQTPKLSWGRFTLHCLSFIRGWLMAGSLQKERLSAKGKPQGEAQTVTATICDFCSREGCGPGNPAAIRVRKMGESCMMAEIPALPFVLFPAANG